MSSTAPPPPPIGSFMPAHPPPVNAYRGVGNANTNKAISSEGDDTIANRRAELDRLKQMQKQHVPMMNMARGQLQGRVPPPFPGSAVLSKNQPPPSEKALGNAPFVINNAPHGINNAQKLASNMPPPLASNSEPVQVARRLEQSFDSSPGKFSPVVSPGKPRLALSVPPTNLAPPMSPPIAIQKTIPVATQQKSQPPSGPPPNGSSTVAPLTKGPPLSAPPNASTTTKGLTNAGPPNGGPPSGAPPGSSVPQRDKADHFPSQPSVPKQPKVSFHPSVPANESTPELKENKKTTFHPSVADPKEKQQQIADPNPRNVSDAGSTPFPKRKEELSTPTEKENNLSTAGHTPFPGKAQPSNAGHTPYHGNPHPSNAGHTPFPSKSQYSDQTTPSAGPTPVRLNNSEEEPPPTTATRSEVLQTMRVFADTPQKEEKADAVTPSVILQPMKQVGFLSPMAVGTPGMNIMMSTPMTISKRAPTPYPKVTRTISTQDEHLIEAAEVLPHEYESPAATYIVRRPYGLASEQDLWYSAGYLNSKMYAKQADVTKASTFEIIANIHCDQSIFTLHGDIEVRHRPNGDKWKEFGNIRDNDIVLGSVTYIDTDATEKKYSLDEICEGALSVRDHYCSSVISTGEGFRLRKDSLPKLASIEDDVGLEDTAPLKQSSSKDANVGTDDELLMNGDEQEKVTKQQPSPPPTVEYPSESASDVLSVAVGMFFTAIFKTIWFVLVRIPFMILTHMFVIMVAIILLSILRLYAADDNGASLMGASMAPYNSPGIL